MARDPRRLWGADPIQFMAPLPPRLLRHGAGKARSLPVPFCHSRARYTFSGTAAIYQAARTLGLRPGDRVLCPAYNCGHEIEPLLRHGVEPDFYAVGLNLEADLDDLKAKIARETRAVLVTHYFGFPQPLAALRELCVGRGLVLIEDCAYALFSRGPGGYLGTEGDMAVFSMRKTLPLPNGGALVVNQKEMALPAELRTPPRLGTWLKSGDLCKKWVLRCFSSPLLRPLRLLALAVSLGMLAARCFARLGLLDPLALWDPDEEDFDFDPAVVDWAMSDIAQRVIGNIDPVAIVRRRRANYRILLQGSRDSRRFRPVFRTLPEGVCPLFFPLVVHNRTELIWSLNRHAIYAAP